MQFSLGHYGMYLLACVSQHMVPFPFLSQVVVLSCAVLCCAVPSGILVSSASQFNDAAVSKAVKILTDKWLLCCAVLLSVFPFFVLQASSSAAPVSWMMLRSARLSRC